MPGDLDTLGALFGGAGILDEEFRIGPEADKINKRQFDRAEGRGEELRTGIQGDPRLEGIDDATISRARSKGQVIVKRPDGSITTASPQDAAKLVNLPGGGEIIEVGKDPTIGEIARGGVQGFKDLETDVLGSFEDLQSSVLGGFQQREQNVLGGFRDFESGINAQAQGRTQAGQGLIQNLMSQLQGGFSGLQGDVAGGFDTLRGDLLGALQGSGGQERTDINEVFTNLGDATTSSLISSGLSGTTINQSLQGDVARQRTDALGRLDERLRQQELGIIGDTGAGALRAQENIGLAGLTSQENLGTFGAGLFSNLSGDALNFATSLGLAGTGLEESLSGQTLGAEERLGGLGLGLEQGLGADAINAGVNFGQIPFNFDLGLTASEIGLDLSQLTQEGVSFITQFANLFASASQPDTPEQSSATENIFTGAFG